VGRYQFESAYASMAGVLGVMCSVKYVRPDQARRWETHNSLSCYASGSLLRAVSADRGAHSSFHVEAYVSQRLRVSMHA
jgi:hypothetical protein